MSKKIIIPTIVILIALLIIIIAITIFLKYNGNTNKVDINLQELNSKILSKSPYKDMVMMDIDKDILSSLYYLGEDAYTEVIGKMPMMNIQASMYLVIKAKSGQVENVKQKLEDYAKSEEKKWSTYLPEQYDLVKQRKLNVVGNYVYLIIADNAQEIEKLIIK